MIDAIAEFFFSAIGARAVVTIIGKPGFKMSSSIYKDYKLLFLKYLGLNYMTQ